MPLTRSGLDAEHDNISGLRVREDGVSNKGICVEEATHGREQNSNGQSLVPSSDTGHLARVHGSVARFKSHLDIPRA